MFILRKQCSFHDSTWDKHSLHGCSKHVAAMLRSTDEPMKLKSKLVKLLQSKNRHSFMIAIAMMRMGWQQAYANMQASVTNMGVVAALVFGELFSFVNSPFQKVEADDYWADHRDNWEQALQLGIYGSMLLALICVMISVVWLTHSLATVHDADDYIWFCRLNNPELVNVSLVLCLTATGMTAIIAPIVVFEGLIASVCLGSSVTVGVIVLLFYLRSRCYTTKRMKMHIEAMVQNYLDILDSEFAKLEGCRELARAASGRSETERLGGEDLEDTKSLAESIVQAQLI
eukprot:TRINITY_DN52371_c0_g1_i1.p1 TRINITY_DN52371_c0_g1~~TRINITY_DN52371_c0_g1_i1.p1  ORF type:complete len:287 (-),score=49.30 TRINITY_DN52371_c0_g1_i1:27-887(-)